MPLSYFNYHLNFNHRLNLHNQAYLKFTFKVNFFYYNEVFNGKVILFYVLFIIIFFLEFLLIFYKLLDDKLNSLLLQEVLFIIRFF